MPVTKHDHKSKLPGKFEDLVRLMPPRAIMDDAEYEDTIEMIDRLITNRGGGKLTKGQDLYLETLVQLVQVYEASHHTIEAPNGIDTLKHLMAEHHITASGLARLLGVHDSMAQRSSKVNWRSPWIMSSCWRRHSKCGRTRSLFDESSGVSSRRVRTSISRGVACYLSAPWH